jgi:hypothetical protein
MSAGLARVMAQMSAGSPLLGGDDELGAMDDGYQLGAENDQEACLVGATYREGLRRGWSQQRAASFARRAAAWARQHGWQPPGGGYSTYTQPGRGGGAQFRGFRSPFVISGDEDELGGDGDELGALDEQELSGIDSEIANLSGDDDEVAGDSREALGASFVGLNRSIGHLNELLQKLEARYNATPHMRFARRKHLLKRMETVRKHIEKKQAKLANKRDRLAAKMGVSPAVLAAGAGGLAAAGISRSDLALAERDMAAGGARMGEGFMSFWGPRTAPDALEVTLPFSNGTSPALYITKGAGAAGSAGAITINTPAISYADFELMGVDIQAIITMAQATDVPPVITVTNWGIAGGFNQVYSEQPINHAGGQIGQAGAGILSYSKNLPALRQDKIELGRTNTASMTLNFWAMKQNGGVIDVVVTASLKLKTKRDDNLAHWR